jgi:lipopolysaccharide/colanic/teichoic acid biosynthesis glycosyltransferase
MIFGVLLPAASVGIPLIGQHYRLGTENSLIAASVCALAMSLTLHRLRQYPGTAVARSIFPVLSSFFAIALILDAVLRIEYSGRILLFSFIATLGARYVIETLHIRAKGILYCVVPGGRAAVVHELEETPVISMISPSLSGLSNCALIADLHADLKPEWERLLAEAAIAGIPVYHYKQVWEAQTGKVQIDHLSENGFGALVPSLIYQKIKRSVDLLACALAMPFALPVMCVCAALIKKDSAGPVFFRQRRMGFRGKEFQVVKFRTMALSHDGADRYASVTRTDDHRITKIGRFLRRTRLDELPQIFNILRGEMSWIGPRPEAVSLSSWYENEIPFYRYRHIVRPGISGWAQINQGHVSSLGEIDYKLQYDFYYIKNLSYWLDIVILVRTVRVILTGFGAK